jgi:outer membrane lipoprotein LolB
VRVICLFVISALLSGCEVLEQLEVIPPQEKPAPAEKPAAHQQQLSKLKNWNLTGRLSIRQGDEAYHASIRWQQYEDSYSIDIIGPLGQGGLQLQGGNQQVVMRTSGNEVYVAKSPEALLKQHLGWQVPIQGLRYWALGRYDPGQKYKGKSDPQGRFSDLKQAGWDIRYKRYLSLKGIDLPGKVFMNTADLDVRLIIDNWHTGISKQNG